MSQMKVGKIRALNSNWVGFVLLPLIKTWESMKQTTRVGRLSNKGREKKTIIVSTNNNDRESKAIIVSTHRQG